MSLTIWLNPKYKYFYSTVQTAEETRETFHFWRFPFDVTSCLISLIKCEAIEVLYLSENHLLYYFIASNFETELARVAHRYTLEVEGVKRNMTWTKIFNPRTVQFSKISPEKRKCKDLKQG